MSKKTSRISRRALLLAEQNHIDISRIEPTGPDGRIIERDILLELEKRASKQDSEAPVETLVIDETMASENEQAISTDITQTQTVETKETETEQKAIIKAPVKTISKEINKKETDSESSEQETEKTNSYGTEVYPHTDVIVPRTETAPSGNPITVTMSFDAGSLMKLHGMIKENGEMMGLPHITVNDMILFAVAKLLKKNKALNAHLLGDKIRCFEGAHLGFYVDTDHGIETATVFDADRLSLSALAKITDALIRGAKAGKLPSEKNRSCASFMISNLGTLGVEAFMPILREPQTGILGICALQRRIKDVNGKDVAYSCIPLSLTFDPRALGTTSASKFLRELCVSLENFELLLIK
jgi:pyruvate dehydrogenase E2 component (dihydrolipoamide acetyltransferase)